MHKIINKFLFTGLKFMLELPLKQPGFMYSACGPFTKRCERIQKFRETGNSWCSNDSNNLANRTISDDILNDRAYEIARNRGYDRYLRALPSIVYKFFDKKAGRGISVNKQLAELHKPVIKRFNRKKSMQDLKTIFREQIMKMLNICYVP